MRRLAFVFLACLLLSTALWSADVLPASPHGQLVRQYLDAFNDGEAAMRAFLEKNPNATPIDERLARYRGMKADLGTMTALRFVGEDAGSLQVIIKNATGEELSLTAMFAPDKLQITGLRLEPIDNGPQENAGQQETSGPPEDESKILREVQDLAEQKSKAGEFSGTVLIARGAVVLWQGAFGFANKDAHILNQADTRFDVGSIAKSFTRVAIAQLVEQGKLKLTDKVGTYLPDYPNQTVREQVTIEQLLDMRSGIGDFFGEKFRAAPKDKIRSLRDYLPFFAADALLFQPGTQQKYSNGGYIVLGLIIESVCGQNASGQSYYDYVEKNIFERAGMKNSAFAFRTSGDPKQAIGYTTLESGEAAAKGKGITDDKGGNHGRQSPAAERHPNLNFMPARGSSAGSAQTTASDLFLYAEALSKGKLVSPATLEKFQVHPDGMGIAGGAPGLNATLDTGITGAGSASYTVVVMSNFDPPSAERLSVQIRGLLHRAK
ncbi:MAG: serine hydrolase domain-containing protein [Terriglobales bacterium]|jgi:D-alanyl-D-alanine carboxypeptidase